MTPDFEEKLAATYGDPDAFSLLVFGTGLHGGQRRYDREHNGQVNFLLPGNSWGKTEFIMRYAFYKAWFKIGPNRPNNFHDWLLAKHRILIASYTYPVAKESFDRLIQMYKGRDEVRALVASYNKQDSEFMLTNGSRLDWGSLDGEGKLVEAARYNDIFVDEVGHIPDLSYVYDNILYPRTLGVAGVIHLFGTPKAHSDPYLLEVYEKGKDGGDGFYYSQSGAVTENEFWPVEEVDRVMKNPRYVTGWEPCKDGDDCTFAICREGKHPILTPVGRQVLLGHFVIEGGLFFNRFSVARMFSWEWELPDLTNADCFEFEPIAGHQYHGAFDLGGNKLRGKSRKKGSDPTVGFVIDYTAKPWKVVYFNYIRGGDADWEQKYEEMKRVYTAFGLPWLTIDATGNIDSVEEALQNRGVETEGMNFGGTGNKKLDMLRNLQLVLELTWGDEKGAIRCPPIPKLRHELDHYILPDEGIEQDCVMALAMVCFQIAQYELPDFTAGEVF